MQIEKKIKFDNYVYYVQIDVEYKQAVTYHPVYGYETEDFPELYLKNFKNNYWDEGNCSILIEKIEQSYTFEKAEVYDENIPLMADVLYIYERIPFLSGIKKAYFSDDDTLPRSITYISKSEIDKYIEDFHIKMNHNPDFTLSSESTWRI